MPKRRADVAAATGQEVNVAKEIKLTRGFVTVVDDEDFARFGHLKWHAATDRQGRTYAAGRVTNENGKRVIVSLHRAIMNAVKGSKVDHRDRDELNNRRTNLRFCSDSQNFANTVKRECNKSGYKGVWSIKNHKSRPYRAKLAREYLGSFATPEEAARAYDAAALARFGEFARLNFPVE